MVYCAGGYSSSERGDVASVADKAVAAESAGLAVTHVWSKLIPWFQIREGFRPSCSMACFFDSARLLSFMDLNRIFRSFNTSSWCDPAYSASRNIVVHRVSSPDLWEESASRLYRYLSTSEELLGSEWTIRNRHGSRSCSFGLWTVCSHTATGLKDRWA